MAEIERVLRKLIKSYGGPLRGWVRMIEQQQTLAGTLFALSLPLLLVLVSGTLYWGALYHLGAELEVIQPRRYGATTLYWCRAALALGFVTAGALATLNSIRERLLGSKVVVR